MPTYNTEIDTSVSEDSSNKDIEDLHDNERTAAIQQKNSSKISSIAISAEKISSEINLLSLRTTVRNVSGNPFSSLLRNENAAEIVSAETVDIISQKVDKSLLTDVSSCENIRNESAAVYSETNRTSSNKIDESSCGNNNEGTAEIVSSERVDVTPDKNDKNLETDGNLRKDIRNESAAKTDCISSYRTVNESIFENICNEDTAEIVSSERVDDTPDKNDKNLKTDGNLRETIRNETAAATQQRVYSLIFDTDTSISSESSEESSSNKAYMNALTNTLIDKDLHKPDRVIKNYGSSAYLQTLDFVAKDFEEKLDILITQITLKNELPKDLQYMLFLILGASNTKNIVLHLIKSDFLQILLNTVDNQPNLTILMLQIVINICEDDEAIDLISSDKKFIQIIVNQLKSFHSVIAMKVFKFLEIIITYKIQKGHHLNWFKKVKKSFKCLDDYLLRILTSDSPNDELPSAIMKVLKLITYDLNISLSILFSNKMNNLIYAFMSSVIKIQTNKDNNFGEICVRKFALFENWLIVMTTVKEYFGTIFLNYENNQHFIILLRIIRNILKHYQQPNALSSKLERKVEQDYQIINQITILLKHIRKDFYLPLVFDRVLANLTFSVSKIVVDLDLDEREANSGKILCKLLNSLKDYWLLCIIEHRNPLQIAEIIYPCEPKACKYLVNLGLSSDITHKKMVMVNVAKNLTFSDC